MSDKNLGHSHFEELCALAAVGDISSTEFAELSDHLRGCAICRDAYNEFVHLTHSELPLSAREYSTKALKTSGVLGRFLAKPYKARFISQAREYGLNIVEPRAAGVRGWIRAYWMPAISYQTASLVAILVLAVVAGIFSHRWKQAEGRAASSGTVISTLREQNATLQTRLAILIRDKQTLESNLSHGLDDRGELINRLRDMEEQSTRDKFVLQDSRAQLKVVNDRDARNEQALQDFKQKLNAANQQIEEFRASRTQNDAALTTQQMQIADLSRRLKEQGEVVEKQQKLLSVDTDVRNLLAARNLHITDVFDVDGRGKKKAAFGRVFYTEGKSLLFYAFDLDAPKVVNAKHSFQAWGQLADASNSAVSLGIFYVDDPAQKRWLLKFDNPDVLKQLSAVFVTAEPHGGTGRPTGQKLMYAYLGHEPNHP